jgi:hypothetical protein
MLAIVVASDRATVDFPSAGRGLATSSDRSP